MKKNNKSTYAPKAIILAVMLSLITAVSVVLGIGFGVYGTDASKWFKNEPAQTNTQQTTTNPLDEIKPVEKLTNDMWVSGWVIDPTKAVDTQKFNALREDHDTVSILSPIDFNTLNFSRELCGGNSNPAFGAVVATDGACYLSSYMGEGFMGNMLAYIDKGTETSIQMGGAHGWGRMSYFGFEPLTEKILFELPVEMRYDCTNYGLIKDFLTPIVVENIERVQPIPFEANRPVKGFKVRDCYINIADSNIHVGDVLLEGTVISNPLEVETTSAKIQFAMNSSNLELCLNAGDCSKQMSMGYNSDLKDGALIHDISNGNSGDLMFANGAVFTFADTTAYMEQKLWRFLEPIYAEKVTDPAEAEIAGYSIDMDKIGYVALESDYYKDNFDVSKVSLSLNELSVDAICLSCEKTPLNAENSLMYIYITDEDLAKIQEQMTAESYTGTIDEYISENNYFDSHATIGEPYGTNKYACKSDYNDDSLTAFVEWLNANGFADAVTPIYSQYK